MTAQHARPTLSVEQIERRLTDPQTPREDVIAAMRLLHSVGMKKEDVLAHLMRLGAENGSERDENMRHQARLELVRHLDRLSILDSNATLAPVVAFYEAHPSHSYGGRLHPRDVAEIRRVLQEIWKSRDGRSEWSVSLPRELLLHARVMTGSTSVLFEGGAWQWEQIPWLYQVLRAQVRMPGGMPLLPAALEYRTWDCFAHRNAEPPKEEIADDCFRILALCGAALRDSNERMGELAQALMRLLALFFVRHPHLAVPAAPTGA